MTIASLLWSWAKILLRALDHRSHFSAAVFMLDVGDPTSSINTIWTILINEKIYLVAQVSSCNTKTSWSKRSRLRTTSMKALTRRRTGAASPGTLTPAPPAPGAEDAAGATPEGSGRGEWCRPVTVGWPLHPTEHNGRLQKPCSLPSTQLKTGRNWGRGWDNKMLVLGLLVLSVKTVVRD